MNAGDGYQPIWVARGWVQFIDKDDKFRTEWTTIRGHPSRAQCERAAEGWSNQYGYRRIRITRGKRRIMNERETTEARAEPTT